MVNKGMDPMKTGDCGRQGHGPYEKLGINNGMHPMKTGNCGKQGHASYEDWELW